MLVRPGHGSGGLSPASCHGDLGSIPDTLCGLCSGKIGKDGQFLRVIHFLTVSYYHTTSLPQGKYFLQSRVKEKALENRNKL
jgi:hypothetical protein